MEITQIQKIMQQLLRLTALRLRLHAGNLIRTANTTLKTIHMLKGVKIVKKDMAKRVKKNTVKKAKNPVHVILKANRSM